MIPHNRPCVGEEDAKAAYATVMSGWLAYGKTSKKLETKLSEFLFKNKKNRAIVCSSGTAALYLALYALNIKNGDEVILSTYACTAILNAIEQIGAKAILVDINENNLNLDFNIVKNKITKNTKAIIIIHTYGIVCEIEKFKTFNIPIIEDCSQSLGSKFKDGTQTGSKGNISIFSFYATKLITGGYGGAISSKNENYITKLRSYIKFDQPNEFYPRFNFLLSDINASIIYSQFNKLDDFLNRRKLIANSYNERLSKNLIKYNLLNGQNYYRFILYCESELQLLKFYKKFRDYNIEVINPLTNSELLHNYIKKDKAEFIISEKLSNRLLSIPIFPCLTNYELKYIISILKELK